MSESYSREAIEVIFGPIDENAPTYIAPWAVSLSPDEHPKISIDEVERRRKMVRRAFRTEALAGMRPTPELDDIWLDFIKGEIESQEISLAVNERCGYVRPTRTVDAGEREDTAPAFLGLRRLYDHSDSS